MVPDGTPTASHVAGTCDEEHVDFYGRLPAAIASMSTPVKYEGNDSPSFEWGMHQILMRSPAYPASDRQ